MFRAAPRLKDADLDEEKSAMLYVQCMKILRRMYHMCRLVHADFSEYNLLCAINYLLFFDLCFLQMRIDFCLFLTILHFL